MSLFVDIAPPETQALELIAYLNKLFLAKDGDQGKEEDKEKEKVDTSEGDKKVEEKSTVDTPFAVETKGLLEKKAYKELVAKLVEAQSIVLETATEKDAEGCFNLLFSLVRRLEATTKTSLIAKLVALTASDPSSHPLLRLRLLGSLYNLLEPSSPVRYEAFVALLNFAVASGNSEVVVPQFGKIDSWLQQWGSAVEQKRELYLIIRKIYTQINNSLAAHEYLVKYLSTYTEASAESAEHAKMAAVEAIKLMEVVESDHLLQLPAVKHLQQTDGQLYRLLELFSKDTLEAFNAFNKDHPAFLASVGLDHDACLRKMRLLSLATLASQHEEVPYSLVSSTLSIDEGEVEAWIILAISANILDARLDQLRRVAVINRVTQRSFSIKEWEQLSKRLHAWRDSTAALLEVVGKHSPEAK